MNQYDNEIQYNISPLIQSQFPAFYSEYGPDFIEFVKQYYIWLEQPNNTGYHTRRILEYKDIDQTVDSFLVEFKKTYLKNIRITSNNAIRTLTKHSLDLYRSKGTDRGIDLLFRAEFGVGAEVYYPSSDLFDLSGGDYRKNNYLELTLNDNLAQFVNKEIVGITSGATAFVDRVIRRSIQNKLIDVMFISTVNGNFQTGEIININDTPLQISLCPTIVGSLNSVVVSATGTGSGFSVGDKVDLISSSGVEAKGTISSTSNIQGVINYNLVEGGYGFTANAQVITSQNILKITNTTFNSQTAIFTTITQPIGTLNYINSNGMFSVGSNVYNYYANGNISSKGTILKSNLINATSGSLVINVSSGNFSNLALYNDANTVGANLTASNGFVNSFVTANLIAIDNTATFSVTNTFGNFVTNDVVYQTDTFGNITAQGTCNNFTLSIGTNGVLTVLKNYGNFVQNQILYNQNSNSSCVLGLASFIVGVVSVNNTFLTTPLNYISTNSFSGTVSYVDFGSGSTFTLANNLLYAENVSINTDYLNNYLSVPLNANAYGFPGNVSANLGTIMDSALTYVNAKIGKLTKIKSINPGQNYSIPPYEVIVEPLVAGYNNPDFILSIANTTRNFQTGELLYQANSNARGLIKSISGNTLFVQNLRFYSNSFFTTGGIINGDLSNAVATIISTIQDYSAIEGENAIISSSVNSGNGAATGVKVVDSGFGFNANDGVSFISKSGSLGIGSPVVQHQGISIGSYQSRNSWLSDQKKLFDGYYWQYFSYDIRSELTIDKYSDILKQVMHMAGKKFFGTFVKKSIVSVNKNKVISSHQ